ncbi:MAG: aquaporin family protein, partial [Pirellulaceae bacterium]|nr:aquaporin family protein [Pirellulaceae bacterium]
MSHQPSLRSACTAELIGTYILVFFGCGAVHADVAYGAQSGLWQVAIVWGIAIMLAIYTLGSVSGAHINPAITVAMAVWRGFPRDRVMPYIGAQVVGAFLAAATLFFLFGTQLAELERVKGVTRGQPGSEITAMCYGEYYPNPGSLGAGEKPYSSEEHAKMRSRLPHHVAFMAEVIGTMILAIVVFGLSDARNSVVPPPGLAAVFIGLTVACLISVIAPLTQACFNPARDFGPRLLATVAGWGSVALPGHDGWSWLTVYIIAPTTGAVLGGAVH